MPRHCHICAEFVPDAQDTEHPYRVLIDCDVCGDYYLSEYVAQRVVERMVSASQLSPAPLPNSYLVSATIRERFEESGKRVPITDTSVLFPSPRPIDPFESVDRFLVNVARKMPRVGGLAEFQPRLDYPLAIARDAQEFYGVLLLSAELDYTRRVGDAAVTLQPAGWRRLEELRKTQVRPGTAFVVMSFAENLQSAFENGIKAALSETGFDVIRADLVQHNGKIDDRIVADIRQSALVVADFSGHRPNVYFEAGFALGLGRAVIWTCSTSDIAAAHFDTRQYNHILWNSPEQLRERLRNRIEATIPPALRRE
jgi:hypothetical protein